MVAISVEEGVEGNADGQPGYQAGVLVVVLVNAAEARVSLVGDAAAPRCRTQVMAGLGASAAQAADRPSC